MISGITSPASFAYLTATTPRTSAPPEAGDQVAMSLSPDTFASLVGDASAMPEVRSDLVETYKAQIQTGQYPAPDVLDGLVDRMGGAWAAQAARS